MSTVITSSSTPAGHGRPRLTTVAFAIAALVAVGSAVALKRQDAGAEGPSAATPAPTAAADTPAAPHATMAAGTDAQVPPTAAGSADAAPLPSAVLAAAASMPAPAGPATTSPSTAPLGSGAEAMVAKLEARLKQEPDDVQGWMMLGRAYNVMGKDKEAVAVYRRIVTLAPADKAAQAQAHADLGRALGKAAGRKLTPEADAELQKALKLDPSNVMAHALLGRGDLERGDAAGAKKHWERALEGVDSAHPFAQQLRQSIDLADSILEAKAKPATGAPADASAAPPSVDKTKP